MPSCGEICSPQSFSHFGLMNLTNFFAELRPHNVYKGAVGNGDS